MLVRINDGYVPPIYLPLFIDRHFIKLLYGGRSSAKTDIACIMKLKRCIELPYFKCLMIRRVRSSVKKSLYSKMKSVAKRLQIDHLFHFNDNLSTIVCLENGNSFLPMGTYETLGSTGTSKGVDDPTDAIVDEMDEITEKEWNDLVPSIRGSEDLEIIGIYNTRIVNPEHWIFKRFFPDIATFERKDGRFDYIRSTRSNTLILHTTYMDNHFNSSVQMQEFELMKLHDPDEYEIAGLGLMKKKKHKNLALPYFKRSTHINEDIRFKPDTVCYLSWDFNNLPHNTVGLWQYGDFDEVDNVYTFSLVKEFCLPEHSITQTQSKINEYLRANLYEPAKVGIMCDYSGNKRDDDNVGQINKVKSELQRGLFMPVDFSIPNPSIISSLDFLNDIFGHRVKTHARNPYPNATIHFQVHPECKFHIADFENTKTGADGKLLKVKKREVFVEDGVNVPRTYEIRGHAVDGSRYFAAAIFKQEFAKHKSKRI